MAALDLHALARAPFYGPRQWPKPTPAEVRQAKADRVAVAVALAAQQLPLALGLTESVAVEPPQAEAIDPPPAPVIAVPHASEVDEQRDDPFTPEEAASIAVFIAETGYRETRYRKAGWPKPSGPAWLGFAGAADESETVAIAFGPARWCRVEVRFVGVGWTSGHDFHWKTAPDGQPLGWGGGGFQQPDRDDEGHYVWGTRAAAVRSGAHQIYERIQELRPAQAAAFARVAEAALGLDVTQPPPRECRRWIARHDEILAGPVPAPAKVVPRMRGPSPEDVAYVQAAILDILPKGWPSYATEVLRVRRTKATKAFADYRGVVVIATVRLFDGEIGQLTLAGRPGEHGYSWQVGRRDKRAFQFDEKTWAWMRVDEDEAPPPPAPEPAPARSSRSSAVPPCERLTTLVSEAGVGPRGSAAERKTVLAALHGAPPPGASAPVGEVLRLSARPTGDTIARVRLADGTIGRLWIGTDVHGAQTLRWHADPTRSSSPPARPARTG